MNIGQRKAGVGRAGDGHAVQAPLNAPGRGAGDGEGKRVGVFGAFNGAVGERGTGDGRRQHHRQGCDAAGGHAKNVGGEKAVVAAAVGRDGGEREDVARRAGDAGAVGKVGSIFTPLKKQRRRAGGGRGENGIAAGENCLVGRRRGNDGREADVQNRDAAGDDASDVGDHKLVAATVVGRDGGDGQYVAGGAGDVAAVRQIRAVEEPTVTEGRCAADCGAEGDIGTIGHRPAGGLCQK